MLHCVSHSDIDHPKSMMFHPWFLHKQLSTHKVDPPPLCSTNTLTTRRAAKCKAIATKTASPLSYMSKATSKKHVPLICILPLFFLLLCHISYFYHSLMRHLYSGVHAIPLMYILIPAINKCERRRPTATLCLPALLLQRPTATPPPHFVFCKHPSFWVRSFILCGRACIFV
jgi:hypothetical protein